MKFSAFLIFVLFWSIFVYDPVCHWVWGSGGWLKKMGVLDFAGGTVVHINAGIAALVSAIVVGKRKSYGKPVPPHNLPFAVLGAGILWFGWFGFNAGSALAANGIAVNAFVVTHTAAAAGGLMWAVLEWIRNGKPTLFGTITGSVAGLATITPAAGFVTPVSAVAIGLIAGLLCFVFVSEFKPRLNLDDSLDAFGVHGIGGIIGTLAAGIFASTAVNPAAGQNGLIYGNFRLFWIQFIAVSVVAAYSFIGTFVILKLIDWVMKVRVCVRDEDMGLDLTQHHETAYTVLE
jgi:Amt family ammonium transporter